jgi:hypothetical protein
MATEPSRKVNPPAVLALLAAFACAGCAGPRQFHVPDATPITAAQKALASSVSEARTHVSAASRHADAAEEHQRTAVVSESKEAVLAGEMAPKLADLRMRVTAELRPEVDAVSRDLSDLTLLHVETGQALADTGSELALAREEIGGTIAALVTADRQASDIRTKYGPEYLAEVQKTVTDANAVILASAAHADREAKAKWMWFSLFLLTAAGFAAFAYFKR